MKLALDRLVHRLTAEPASLDRLAEDDSAALSVGITAGEVRMLLDKDLRALRDAGLHPLLVMQFAGTFGIEPMGALVDTSRAPRGT